MSGGRGEERCKPRRGEGAEPRQSKGTERDEREVVQVEVHENKKERRKRATRTQGTWQRVGPLYEYRGMRRASE